MPLPELSAWPSRFVKKGSQEAEDAYSQVAAESDEGQTRALLGAAALLNHACRQHAQVQTADWRTFQLRYSCRKGEQLFIYYNQSRASLPCARFRPEDVLGSCRCSAHPSSFQPTREAGDQVSAWIRAMPK